MKVWVGCARGVQVAYVTLHHRGCTLVPPSTWAKRVPRVEASLVPPPYTRFIRLCTAGGQVRVIGAVPCRAKTCGADHNIKKLCRSSEWRGQSDLFNINAVHAKRAVLPSRP